MFQTVTLFGHSISLYNFFNNFSYVGQLIFVLITIEEYRKISVLAPLADARFNSKGKKDYFHKYFFAMLELLCVTAVSTIVNNAAAPLISNIFLGENCANYFPNIFVSPFLVFALCILLKVSPMKGLDYAAPFAVIALICFKIACYCEGCCYGIEYGSTFFNHLNNRYEVPVQLIELGCAVIMLIVLLIVRRRRRKYGLMYPLFTLMYCGTRFFSEFLRDDFPPVWGRLTGYHIQIIIGFVLGLVCLLLVLKYSERLTAYCEAKNREFYGGKIKEIRQRYKAKAVSGKNGTQPQQKEKYKK